MLIENKPLRLQPSPTRMKKYSVLFYTSATPKIIFKAEVRSPERDPLHHAQQKQQVKAGQERQQAQVPRPERKQIMKPYET